MTKRILLVEDEEDNLTLLVHILKFLLGQEQLYIAKDGHEAMMLAYQQRPDVILMDLSLPKLDGWETVRSLRADESFRATPIIALTAHAMSGDKEKALDAGCSDYFPKPIDIDRFIPFIQPYLSSPTPGPDSAPRREETPPLDASAAPAPSSTDASPAAPVAAQPAAPQTAVAPQADEWANPLPTVPIQPEPENARTLSSTNKPSGDE